MHNKISAMSMFSGTLLQLPQADTENILKVVMKKSVLDTRNFDTIGSTLWTSITLWAHYSSKRFDLTTKSKSCQCNELREVKREIL